MGRAGRRPSIFFGLICLLLKICGLGVSAYSTPLLFGDFSSYKFRVLPQHLQGPWLLRTAMKSEVEYTQNALFSQIWDVTSRIENLGVEFWSPARFPPPAASEPRPLLSYLRSCIKCISNVPSLLSEAKLRHMGTHTEHALEDFVEKYAKNLENLK